MNPCNIPPLSPIPYLSVDQLLELLATTPYKEQPVVDRKQVAAHLTDAQKIALTDHWLSGLE